jgi:hypothetical protein
MGTWSEQAPDGASYDGARWVSSLFRSRLLGSARRFGDRAFLFASSLKVSRVASRSNSDDKAQEHADHQHTRNE